MPTGIYKRTVGMKTGKHPSFWKGKKLKEETRIKLSLSHKGDRPWRLGKSNSKIIGKKHWNWKGGFPKCIECKKKLTNYNIKRCRNCDSKFKTGERNWKWIKDRTKLAKKQIRNDPAYREWRKNVWVRDKYKCRIGNLDCSGRIQSHHILPWRDFLELRYEVNNGITLCQFHHPRRRNEEKRLIPVFQELVSVSKI